MPDKMSSFWVHASLADAVDDVIEHPDNDYESYSKLYRDSVAEKVCKLLDSYEIEDVMDE